MVGCSEFCRNFAFAIFFLSPLHRKHHYLRLLRKDTVWKKERKKMQALHTMSPENPSRMSHDTMAVVRGGLVACAWVHGTALHYYCQHRSMGFHTAGSVASKPPVYRVAREEGMLPCPAVDAHAETDRRRRAPRAVARDLEQRQLRPSIPPGNALDSVGN